MRKLYLIVFLYLAGSTAWSQSTPKNTTSNPYEAGLTAVLSRIRSITEGKTAISSITGTSAPRDAYGSMYYDGSTLAFPGEIDHTLEYFGISWESKGAKAKWGWRTKLLFFETGASPEKVINDAKLINAALIRLMPGAVKQSGSPKAGSEHTEYSSGNITVYVDASYPDVYKRNHLHLDIRFTIPFRQIKQQAIDSLLSGLNARMVTATSPEQKAKLIVDYGSTLKMMSFSKDELRSQGIAMVQKAANIDMSTAFYVIMEWPIDADITAMKESLTYPQQAVLKDKAQQLMDDYHREKKKAVTSETGPTDVAKKNDAADNSPEAVARRKKEEECKAAILRNPLKAGTMFDLPWESDKEQKKFIISGPYDCKTKSYPGSIHFWRKTVGDKGYFVGLIGNMSPDELKNARKAEGMYSFCHYCNGTGIVEIKEQTQVVYIEKYKVERNKLVPVYSDPTWVHYGKHNCNLCGGHGYYGGK